MKFKYEVKDERVKSLLSELKEEKIQKQIENQIDDLSSYVSIPVHVNKKLGVSIYIDKSLIKEVPWYKPDDWNPFPQVLPPESKRYLIQFEDDSGAKKLDVESWIKSNTEEENLVLWKRYKVVAFRELPPFFDPKELKND